MKKLKLKGNEVVHCATLKQAKKVLKIAHELGLTWKNGDSYKENNTWGVFNQNTYFNLNKGTRGNIEVISPEYTIITSKEFIKRHKKASLKKRIKALEAIVNGTNESNEVEQPKIGDVVKAWDNDKSKFVYGVYNGREEYEVYYIVGEVWFENIEKVTEISINDFKK